MSHDRGLPLRIDAGSADDVWRVIGSAGRSGSSYVCFANAHLVVEAYRDPAVLDALNGSLLTLPDGAPVAAMAGVSRMTGSDTFELVCSRGQAHPYRHFFVGATAARLAELVDAVRARFPELVVAGAIAPPFGEALFDSLDETVGRVAEAEPDFIWVGLGAPRQELWMAEAVQKLPRGVMFGVGAVFDFASGRIPRAPWLLRATGQEWLFRLAVEPRRLWRRYLTTASGLAELLFLRAVHRRRLVDRRPIPPDAPGSPSRTGWSVQTLVYARRVRALPRLWELTDPRGFLRLVTPSRREKTVVVRALGGARVTLRPGTSDTDTFGDVFGQRSHLPPASVAPGLIWDLGANIGLTMAHLAHVYPEATIVGVELDAANAALARSNARSAQVIEAAVWPERTRVGVRRRAGHESGSRVTHDGAEVVTLPLNDLLARTGPPDYVKMDIEGAERRVLCENVEWAACVQSIMVECHGSYSARDCTRDLERLGFTASALAKKHGRPTVFGSRARSPVE